MKASFPPFASCFPPWSCCARPAPIASACRRSVDWTLKSDAMISNSWAGQPSQKASPGGEAVGLVPTDEARNPPLPVADQGRCSANEATSFARVSAAKRLCRIERTIGHEMAVIMTNSRMTPLRRLHLIRAAKAAHLLLKEKAFGGLLLPTAANRTNVFRTQLSPARQRSWTRGLAKPDRRGKAKG